MNTNIQYFFRPLGQAPSDDEVSAMQCHTASRDNLVHSESRNVLQIRIHGALDPCDLSTLDRQMDNESETFDWSGLTTAKLR